MLRHLRSAAQAGIFALSLSTLAVAQQPELLPPPGKEPAVVQGELPPAEVHGGPASHEGVPYAAGPFGGYPYSGGWHAGYQQPMHGRPLALLVPPVSHYQTIYSWGIGTTQIAPIPPQYGGPGTGTPWTDAGQYPYPPYWPWDTRQFGVYYIRGPW